ncbi:MAG TPA: hypothetical protein VN607_08015, partial [Gemmatimonadaceae bacterium]|nr:hypothetical protein [Gemmatimonadaceae bacterium]
MQAIVAQVITGEPRSLAARRKSVPPHVDAAVSTALEKLPADRFENAKAFADALGDLGFRAGSARSTVPARTSRSRMVPLLGAALVAAAALGAWGWLRPAPTAAAAVAWRVPIALPDSLVPVGSVSISGDGSTIFFGAEVHGVRQLYRLTAATGRAEPVPGVPGGWISPDGRRVAYQKGTGDIVVQSLGGSVPAVVAHIGRARLGHWLDDEHLLVKDQDGLLSVPTGGGAPMRLIRRDSTAIYDNAAPLPPGDGILFNIFAYGGRFDTARAGIAAVGLRGGKMVRLTQGRFAEFAPPDHLIVNRVGDGSIVAFPFDPKRLRITGPSVPIVTGLPPGGYSDVGEFDVSATGRMVYLEGDDSRRADQIVRVDRSGAVTPVDTLSGEALQSAIAPNGSRIAAIVHTPIAYAIEVRDLATGAVSRINTGAQFASLAWASDSRSLFYVALTSSNVTIYRAVPDTVGAPQAVLRMPLDTAVADPMPSADGRTLYFTQLSAGMADIRSVPLDGHGAARVVAAAPARWPVPSPDGRWLAYHTGGLRAGVDTLVVRSTNASRSEVWRVAAGVADAPPRWSRDGKALYFIARDSMRAAMVAPGADFRIASTKVLFPRGALEPDFDVTPDGRFVMARPLASSAPAVHLVMIENWARVTP